MLLKLFNAINDYDKYGEHRLNGFKGVYVFMMLCCVNFFYSVHNPYFNYFYVPLTAMTISVTGDTIKDKLRLFVYTVMGAIFTIFIFSLTDIYPILFVFVVFFMSICLYWLTLYYFKANVATVPVMLSLGIYSLVYGHINTDLFVAINNALITFLAMIIVLVAMLYFPRRYYFKIWLRAYLLLLKQICQNFVLVKNDQERAIQVVQGNLVQLVKYANMLSRKLPIFTILKINFLANELRVLSCTIDQKIISLSEGDLIGLIDELSNYISAVKKKSAYHPQRFVNKDFTRMVRSWNYLCSKI